MTKQANQPIVNPAQPLLSIIIPVTETVSRLRDLINAALIQSLEQTELILVVPSNVKESTRRLAALYAQRARVIYLDKDAPQGCLIHEGAKAAKGKYFTWITGGQVWKIDTAAEMLDAWGKLQTADGAAIFGSDADESAIQARLGSDCVFSGDALGQPSCSFLVPASLYLRCPVDSRLDRAANYDYLLRLCTSGVPLRYFRLAITWPDASVRGETWEYDTVQSSWMQKADAEAFKQYLSRQGVSIHKYLSDCAKADQAAVYGAAARLFYGSEFTELLHELHRHVPVSLSQSRNLASGTKELQSGKPIIVFYVNVWRFGGIERVVSLLLPGLVEKYTPVLVTSKDPEHFDHGYDIPDEVLHLIVKPRKGMKIDRQLAFICASLGASIFVGTPNIVKDFLPVYQHLSRMGIKTIASHHHYYYLPYMVTWSWLHEIADMRAEAVKHADVATWPLEFSALCDADACANTIAMPNPNTFAPMGAHPVPTEKVVLVVGRFYDIIKRVDRAMMVFKKVHELDPSVKFVLLGEYRDDMAFPLTGGQLLKDWLKSIQYPFHNTIFAGEQENVVSYYQSASVLLMPSECEGFGMSITEAGVAGVPVVTTAYPGCEELVKDGVNGYSFDPDDYEEAARHIVHILDHPELWKEMSLNAQKMASRFEKEVIVQKYCALFDAMLAAGTDKDALPALLDRNGFGVDAQRVPEANLARARFLEHQLMLRLRQAE